MKRLSLFIALGLLALGATGPAAGAAGAVAALGRTALAGPLRVRPLRVIEDSRCPINARCVWAGRLVLRARVSGSGWTVTRDLALGEPATLGGGRLTLVAAEPGRLTGRPTDPRAYRFAFAYERLRP